MIPFKSYLIKIAGGFATPYTMATNVLSHITGRRWGRALMTLKNLERSNALENVMSALYKRSKTLQRKQKTLFENFLKKYENELFKP